MEITDQDGRRPLHVEDESERIENLFLAAASPRLYDALGLVLNRLEHLTSMVGYRLAADQRLLQYGHAALIDARPTPEQMEQLKERDRQLDLFRTA